MVGSRRILQHSYGRNLQAWSLSESPPISSVSQALYLLERPSPRSGPCLLQNTFKPVLSSQSRARVNRTIQDRWLFNTRHFAVEMNIWYHRMLIFKSAGGFLIEVSANIGLTVMQFYALLWSTCYFDLCPKHCWIYKMNLPFFEYGLAHFRCQGV